MDWIELNQDPLSLVDARLHLHHAVQLVSGVGRTYLEKKPDDSHTALTWSEPDAALVGRPLDGCTASLALGSAELRLTRLDGKASGFALAESTLEEAEQWLIAQLASCVRRELAGPAPLHYAIPSHSYGEGAPLTYGDSTFKEIESWFKNANTILSEARRWRPHTTEILCWPHHFDIAFLIELDCGRDVEHPRTIGVGLSPGDDYAEQPYLYVGPYPRPADAPLPSLTIGRWRTEGAFNIVLPGSEIVDAGPAASQAEVAQSFLAEAIAVAQAMLDRD